MGTSSERRSIGPDPSAGGRSLRLRSRWFSSSKRTGSESSRVEEMLSPVRIIEAVFAHDLSRAGGMYELGIPDSNAHMRELLAELVEEQEVAFADVSHVYGMGPLPERGSAVRDIHARVQIAVANQTAAIETGGTFALEFVRFADKTERGVSRFFSDRGRIEIGVIEGMRTGAAGAQD